MKKLIVFAVCAFLLTGCSSKKTENQKSEPRVLHRIVCLSPAGAEILCELGAENLIVARTDYCDYPENIKEIPSVGGFDGKNLSIERILSYQPELVYGSKGMHDFVKDSMETFGIKVYLSTAESIDAILEEITQVSVLIGREKEGTELAQKISGKLTSLKKGTEVYTAYYEVFSEPYFSCGASSYINELLNAAGCKNIFDSVEESYPMVSEEAIIEANPQIIFIPDTNGITLDSVYKRKGWIQIDAVKNHRVYFVNGNVISRPGPRFILALEELIEKVEN